MVRAEKDDECCISIAAEVVCQQVFFSLPIRILLGRDRNPVLLVVAWKYDPS